MLDVTIQVNPDYRFRALVVHLKSKRPVPEMSQAAMRLEEARIVRRHAVRLLRAKPGVNLLLMGDLNDEPDSAALKAVRGREPPLLYPLPAVDRQGRAFTHFWATGGRRSQIDYLLVNEAMRAEVVSGGIGVADADGWNDASDHRAVYARFHAVDRDPAISQLVPGQAEDAAPVAQVPTQSGWVWVASLAGVVVVILIARRLGWYRRAS